MAVADAVLVFNYLDRASMPRILQLVAPGGLLMMETFLEAQREALETVDAERWRAVASVIAERK